MPLRRIAYPSHGTDCADPTGTLLASYAWCQDATRLGAKIARKCPSQKTPSKSDEENELVEEILSQLVLVHGPVVREEYTGEYFMMNWNDNPLSMGAFALFGPGQFTHLYRSMIRAEAEGHVHFAGCSASVHHGWIEGALNAAYRTVMEIFEKESMHHELAELKNKWGLVDELDYFS